MPTEILCHSTNNTLHLPSFNKKHYLLLSIKIMECGLTMLCGAWFGSNFWHLNNRNLSSNESLLSSGHLTIHNTLLCATSAANLIYFQRTFNSVQLNYSWFAQCNKPCCPSMTMFPFFLKKRKNKHDNVSALYGLNFREINPF